jgi:manganese/zinc/iron transport system permease protein
MDDLIAILTLRSSYNATVVIFGATCLGIATGIIGSLALLRKRALLGDALAHCSLPGLCGAFLLLYTFDLNPRNLVVLLTGAAFSGLIGIGCIQFLVRFTRLREDAVIGIILSVFFGFGVVLLSIIQYLGDTQGGGLHHFIYGQTATMRLFDAYLTIAVAVGTTALCILLLKEFRLICFDSEFALAQGWPVARLDLLLMSLIVLITTVGLQSVGLILIVALLIIPAASARFWSEQLSKMIYIAGIIGGLSGYIGAVLSCFLPRFPAGAVIVLTSGVFFTVSFLFAPSRGLLAALIRQFALRTRIIEDHYLRELYEQQEESPSSTTQEMYYYLSKSWSFGEQIVLWRLVKNKFVNHYQGRYHLTQTGLKKAFSLVRNHRLWEEYLIQYADIDTLHVDRSADIVEHVLSAEVVAQLESAIALAQMNPKEKKTLNPPQTQQVDK